MNQSDYLKDKDFSIVLGGPFFQLLRRIHLTGNHLELLRNRIIVITLIAWLPLFLLSMLKGQAWGEGSNLPFIQDIDVHLRFLVAVPLLIMAELIVHQRMIAVIDQFGERKLIPESGAPLFNKAIEGALRWRNSILAEVVMVIIIYVIGYQIVWRESSALETTAWYSEPAVAGGHLSFSGIWFRYISLPLFQFLLLRWYFRILIWVRFLFQVSRIKLNLLPTHPDHVGGLGFLSNSINAFKPLALAHGVLLAGMISNHIFHEGAVLMDFKIVVVVIVLWVIGLVILPLLSFSGQLAEVSRHGSLGYGKLASRFVLEFERKWMKEKGADDSSSLGADIQSLADLSNSYNVVQDMKFVPLSRNDVIGLAIIVIAPVLPLVLTMMPLSDVIKMLAGVLF